MLQAEQDELVTFSEWQWLVKDDKKMIKCAVIVSTTAHVVIKKIVQKYLVQIDFTVSFKFTILRWRSFFYHLQFSKFESSSIGPNN